MTYAIFLSIFAVAAFCGFRLGRLSAFSECDRRMRCLAEGHRRALAVAVIRAARHSYTMARAGMEAARRLN